MNKIISKSIFTKNKILTPKYFSLNFREFTSTSLKTMIFKKKIHFPIVVKPISEGSSLGVKITQNINNLVFSAKLLFKNTTN